MSGCGGALAGQRGESWVRPEVEEEVEAVGSSSYGKKNHVLQQGETPVCLVDRLFYDSSSYVLRYAILLHKFQSDLGPQRF